MKRYEALKILVPEISKHDVVLFSTGMISREAASVLDRDGHFYIIGSMGLVSSVGLGIAVSTSRKVWVIDGDGSALMDLGTMANVAEVRPRNFIHVILDNGQYQSTGGQPTISAAINLAQIAKVVGYKWAEVVDGDLTSAIIKSLARQDGPSCLVVKVEGGMEKVPRICIDPNDMSSRIKTFITESL